MKKKQKALTKKDGSASLAVTAALAVWPIYSKCPNVALVELIDGAYDIIEIWKAESPSQVAWKKAWMAKARELGAHPSW